MNLSFIVYFLFESGSELLCALAADLLGSAPVTEVLATRTPTQGHALARLKGNSPHEKSTYFSLFYQETDKFFTFYMT